MKQGYPDPAQLRTYSDDPIPFHEITADDLTIREDGTVVATIEEDEHTVVYEFEPSHIKVRLESGMHAYLDELTHVDFSHNEAWNEGIDFTIGEDYISLHGDTPRGSHLPPIFDAFWTLDTVLIQPG